ncbi:molybdate ABC transporter substrate-binding protein [uncultured Shimia sp.]|uniref:molybdate ABC transporter substrate-binding protein n=1 Tax=uncultured Shimia sp. TaxID=573152 RepID=UPI0026057078|nr:molybdate ABC transporter substrate-binding protein [uncultured Shimia sp.]
MLKSSFSALCLSAGVFLATAPSVTAEQVTVFAAASLQEALSDVIAGFEAESGHDVTASFAGSSALARQIEYGAPADVIMLANVNWVAHLDAKGLLEPGRKNIFLGNRMSVVVPARGSAEHAAGDSVELSQILNTGRVAMAFVEAVPAGMYGKEALQSLGLWDAVRPNVVETDNVRAALALVALGEVAAGIVYATDALVDDRVRIVAQFPAESHSNITYPAAIIVGQDRPEVVDFMTYLDGSVARKAFVDRGFIVAEDGR